jgi:hypothetical protein
VEAPPTGRPATTAPATPARKKKSHYPYWFYLPAAVIFFVFFVVPTFSSFFFSLTRWDLSTWEFIGLDNYVAFFQESALITGLRNTLIYAVYTCGLKVVLGMLLALLLTSQIMARWLLRSVVFFPVLVSTIGVGEVVPGFVGFEVGSSPERLTWDAPRTAKSEEEDPGCKTPTRPPRAPRRRLPIVTGCGWSVRPPSGWMSDSLAVWTATWLGSPSTCARACWPRRSRLGWTS